MPKGSSTYLHLCRHGETADNAALVFQGQSGKGLNALGRAQAARLGERFRTSPPDAIVSSDLERAVETARIVAAACGIAAERIALDRGLREIDVGAWTGKDHRAIAELYPEEWAAWSAGLDVRRGGGETYAELAERIDRALDRIAEAHHGARVLVVSHGGAIRSVIGRVLGVSAEGFRALAAVGNAGITLLQRITHAEDGQRRDRLHSWNDVAHLEGLVVDDHTD